MLSRENYTEVHINDLRAQTGADPSILERTVFAFGLLEAIRIVELPDGLHRRSFRRRRRDLSCGR